jgi:hypothetical protein
MLQSPPLLDSSLLQIWAACHRTKLIKLKLAAGPFAVAPGLCRRCDRFSKNCSMIKLVKSFTMVGRENCASIPCRENVRSIYNAVEFCWAGDILN